MVADLGTCRSGRNLRARALADSLYAEHAETFVRNLQKTLYACRNFVRTRLMLSVLTCQWCAFERKSLATNMCPTIGSAQAKFHYLSRQSSGRREADYVKCGDKPRHDYFDRS
jgi:hypothetical protein